MDFVAALEQQKNRTSGGGGSSSIYVDETTSNNNNNNSNTVDNNNLANGATSDANSFSPKEMRKFDSKKRWKNWGWKYSPGKTSSIEEEPPTTETATSTPSAKTSRHSSPTSSPKHKKADKESGTAATVVSQLLNQSPLRRRPQSGQASTAAVAAAATHGGSGSQRSSVNDKLFANITNQSSIAANRIDIRSSAGARLCQQFENPDDDLMNDEFQALIINGRPASVHIVSMSSTQLQ